MQEKTVYNFNAGPATLPKAVMLKAQEEFVNYRGCGYGIVEESHRAAPFEEVIQAAEANIRKLMGISADYDVLFLQGGASLQFAMVPMNLMVPGKKIAFCDTGEWSHKAMKEAKILGAGINMVYDGAKDNFSCIGDVSSWQFDQNDAYAHICSNNTIYGTAYNQYPETGALPLIADMSSDIMSKVVDVNRFALIFAGAQKNMGPSGVTLVIIRKGLAERCPETIPTMLRYSTHIKAQSLFNTPSTFSIYMVRLVTDWMLEQGGVPAIQMLNEAKAGKLYAAIDESGFFRGTCAEADRSLMNVCFRIGEGNEELEKKFVSESKAAGLIGLKGHRAVGGLRASIYNAMPMAGIDALVAFMKAFAAKNG
ncbi:MAG: 3-phosphoserine/phosphohydroxythreonine transaminase [Lentisphaeria bacterium]|nr:3-phosphoserine/phosphohydroxythreonine transaminase [Lentisphaeria bacterium]